MKLSKRERVMVYIMILVVIVGVGFLVVDPIRKESVSNGLLLDDKYMEYDMLQAELMSADVIKSKTQEYKDFYEKHKNDYKEIVTNDVLEQIVTKKTEDYNLKPLSGSISFQKFENEASEDTSEEGDAKETEDIERLMLLTESMSLTGKLSDFMAYIEACEKDKDMVILEFSVNSEQNAGLELTDAAPLAFSVTTGYFVTSDLLEVIADSEDTVEDVEATE